MAGCGLLIFIPFALMGLFVVYKEHSLMGWLIFLLFAGLCGTCLWLYFDRRPRLVINQIGVSDQRSKAGVIEWRDISSLNIVRTKNTQHIQLGVVEPAKYFSRMGKLQKLGAKLDNAVGLDEISINATGLEMSPDEIAAIISERVAQAQNKEQ